MRLPKIKKKSAIIGLSAMLVLAAGGIAAAYFTSSGSGTGHGAVGTSTAWVLTGSPSVTGHAYPTATHSTTTFKFKNTSTGKQAITSTGKVTVSVVSTGGTIKSGGTKVTGCKVSWFTPTKVTTSAWVGVSVAHGGHITIKVQLTMNNGTGATGSSQDLCKTKSPTIKVTIAA